jgi:endo-1,4-beta-xylanase
VATDTCDASPVVRLVSITSNEPDNGLGDGDQPGDIQGASFGTDDRQFLLRSERSGTGQGRIYTITYLATDASGNTTVRQATVTVPHP